MISTYPFHDIHLRPARLASADFWTPVAFNGSEQPRYRATLLLSVTDPAAAKTLEEVLKAADRLWQRANPGNTDAQLPRPIATPGNAKKGRDGRILPGYENTAVVNASAQVRPTLVGYEGEELKHDDGSLRPGDWVHAILRLRAFTGGNSPGVWAELRGVKHLEVGAPIGFTRCGDAKPTVKDFYLPGEEPLAGG